jgi:hypothetical protein
MQEQLTAQAAELYAQFLVAFQPYNEMLSKKVFFIFTGWHIVLFVGLQFFKNIKNIWPTAAGGKGTVSAAHILVKV